MKLAIFRKLLNSKAEEHDVGVESKESTKGSDEEERKSITEEDSAAIAAESKDVAMTVKE